MRRIVTSLATALALVCVAVGTTTPAQATGETDILAERVFYHPTSGTVTSRFNWRCPGADNHDGVDIANSQGTRIRAARGGDLVGKFYDAGGYGHYVILRHASGYTTLYAHLSQHVNFGGHANTNELIGYMGQSGGATGPHLHFEIRRHGNPLNINGSYNCGEHVRTYTYLRQSFPDLNPI